MTTYTIHCYSTWLHKKFKSRDEALDYIKTFDSEMLKTTILIKDWDGNWYYGARHAKDTEVTHVELTQEERVARLNKQL